MPPPAPDPDDALPDGHGRQARGTAQPHEGCAHLQPAAHAEPGQPALTDRGRDIDALSAFRFTTHPKLKPAIEKMKSELTTYQDVIKDIKPRSQRLNAKGKDTFDLGTWWCANAEKVPSRAYVLRAVLTNSPNSIPPERHLRRRPEEGQGGLHRALTAAPIQQPWPRVTSSHPINISPTSLISCPPTNHTQTEGATRVQQNSGVNAPPTAGAGSRLCTNRSNYCQ